MAFAYGVEDTSAETCNLAMAHMLVVPFFPAGRRIHWSAGRSALGYRILLDYLLGAKPFDLPDQQLYEQIVPNYYGEHSPTLCYLLAILDLLVRLGAFYHLYLSE